jgi:hypothetical protein
MLQASNDFGSLCTSAAAGQGLPRRVAKPNEHSAIPISFVTQLRLRSANPSGALNGQDAWLPH